jgi:REP element-mobilizing transposase RayT
MPRRLRLDYPGAIHHVMARGNRKARIFEDDDDRRIFLGLVAQMVERYLVKVYVLCLMDNHYHFVGETPRGNLSAAMRQLNGVYAQTSNRRHRRTGHLFGGRFRSMLIQREGYLKRATRYVLLNPVRARIVSNAADWPWSTYRATVGLDVVPEWLSLDWLDAAYDAPTRADAQERFGLYVNSPIARKARIDASAIAFGSKHFVRQIAQQQPSRQPDRPLPPVFVPIVRPPLGSLFDDVRGAGVVRDQAVRDACVKYGYRLSQIAAALGVDPSTVSKALRRARLRPTL